MDAPNHVSQPGNPADAGARPLAVEMRDVTVVSIYNPSRIMLTNVTWSVSTGDYWAVCGLQATGKTDLLATIAGLALPAAGTCRVLGQEMAAGYEGALLETRLRIGLVFDGGRLLQHLTLADNVLLPLRYHENLSPPELEKRCEALLNLIGLARHADTYPNALGLNWQQRGGLARALALQPEILLVDNPLAGLDPLHTQWWLKVLDQLATGHELCQHRPLTLVVTTDDLRPWKNHARQFAILKDQQFLKLEQPPGTALPPDPELAEMLGVQWPKPGT